MRRKVLQTFAIALSHFVASVSAFLWSYTVSSEAFDGRHISWLSRNLAKPLFEFLWFPLGTAFIQNPLSGMWIYLALLMNSVLWSFGILAIYRFARRRYAQSSA